MSILGVSRRMDSEPFSYMWWSSDGLMSHVADSMGMFEGIEYTCSKGCAQYVFAPLVVHPS